MIFLCLHPLTVWKFTLAQVSSFYQRIISMHAKIAPGQKFLPVNSGNNENIKQQDKLSGELFNWHGLAGKEDRTTVLFSETRNAGNNPKRELEPWKELWKCKQEKCSVLTIQLSWDLGEWPTLLFIVLKMTCMCIYSLLSLGILDKYVSNTHDYLLLTSSNEKIQVASWILAKKEMTQKRKAFAGCLQQ